MNHDVMNTEDRLMISNSSYHMNKDHLISSNTSSQAPVPPNGSNDAQPRAEFTNTMMMMMDAEVKNY